MFLQAVRFQGKRKCGMFVQNFVQGFELRSGVTAMMFRGTFLNGDIEFHQTMSKTTAIQLLFNGICQNFGGCLEMVRCEMICLWNVLTWEALRSSWIFVSGKKVGKVAQKDTSVHILGMDDSFLSPYLCRNGQTNQS